MFVLDNVLTFFKGKLPIWVSIIMKGLRVNCFFAGVGRTHMVYFTQHKPEQKARKVCIILHLILLF